MKSMRFAYDHSTCSCEANCSQAGSLQTPAAHVAVKKMSRLEKAIVLAMKLTARLMAPLSQTRRAQLSWSTTSLPAFIWKVTWSSFNAVGCCSMLSNRAKYEGGLSKEIWNSSFCASFCILDGTSRLTAEQVIKAGFRAPEYQLWMLDNLEAPIRSHSPCHPGTVIIKNAKSYCQFFESTQNDARQHASGYNQMCMPSVPMKVCPLAFAWPAYWNATLHASRYILQGSWQETDGSGWQHKHEATQPHALSM